jgi:hypothetical protein
MTVPRIIVAVTIDTEEDNWARFDEVGATTRNIAHLPELQDLFDHWGVRPTYLVNRPPLLDPKAVQVLGALAARESVEIGAHCHPWNTPPLTGSGAGRSMMASLTDDQNRAKIRDVGTRLAAELGVQPRAFRAGRWGFGPTVARPLVLEGYVIDASVTPFMDWRSMGGPDYTDAPSLPYRFDPDQPLKSDAAGALLELPPTIGFLRSGFQKAARIRRRLEAGPVTSRTCVGPLDRLGFFAKRWLSPENASGETMIRLADACLGEGQSYLQATFHSSALLPGATPFVRSERDRRDFMLRLDTFLGHCWRSGFEFLTLTEIQRRWASD